MRYHFYMFLTPLSTLLRAPTPPTHTYITPFKWVKEKCVYLEPYDACIFLFLLHFLCYSRFSYRRYKTEKYISKLATQISTPALKALSPKTNVSNQKNTPPIHENFASIHTELAFRKKIKTAHI